MGNTSFVSDQGIHLMKSSRMFPDLYGNITTLLRDNNSRVDNSNTAPPEAPLSTLEKFSRSYEKVHGYLALTICSFGIISNVINTIVLTRKHMRTPTNLIFAALAVADMLTLMSFDIVVIIDGFLEKLSCGSTKQKTFVYIFFHEFCYTCHSIGLWLTVALTFFRYILVGWHQLATTMCTMKRAKLTILLVSVAPILILIPYYLTKSVKDPDGDGPCEYQIMLSAIAIEITFFIGFAFWLAMVTVIILPCFLLIFLSALLIKAIHKAKTRRELLFRNTARITDSDNTNEHIRTTMMLIAVVLCTTVSELPRAILLIMGVTVTDFPFYTKVYDPLHKFLVLLIVANSVVNFILYCSMSKNFRDTFKVLFLPKRFPYFFRRSQ